MNLLTVDVEDWAGSSLSLLSRREALKARQWLPGKDPQVERGTHRILELLEENNCKATFFVVGKTARTFPSLTREIHRCGHEVASHSMTHVLLPGLGEKELQYEIEDSKKLLEDLVGGPVLGFRAPCLTCLHDRAVFFETLWEAGYRYDSSSTVVPGVGSDACGAGGGIREFPVTAVCHWGVRVPLGGTYLKLLGWGKVSREIEKENRSGRYVLLYLHPYELDEAPVCWPHPSPSVGAGFSLWLRNIGKGRHLRILKHLLKSHRFTGIRGFL
jgi:hypothetical protein